MRKLEDFTEDSPLAMLFAKPNLTSNGMNRQLCRQLLSTQSEVTTPHSSLPHASKIAGPCSRGRGQSVTGSVREEKERFLL